MKFDLPKTRTLWQRVLDAIDNSKLQTQHNQIVRDIESANDRLKKCESVEEYHEISKEIQSLQEQLTLVEIEQRIHPKRANEARKNEMPKLPDLYNEEFKPYYDRYLKLDKELKKQLKKFAEDTEGIAKEMLAIERMERSFSSTKMAATLEDHRKYLKLPISTKSLKKPYSLYATGDFTFLSEVNTLIQQIKKIK